MKFMDIMTKRTYEKNGEQKNVWLKCGTLRINDDGKQFIELNHLPGIPFFVFEQRTKDGTGSAPAASPKPSNNPSGAARPEDIAWEE